MIRGIALDTLPPETQLALRYTRRILRKTPLPPEFDPFRARLYSSLDRANVKLVSPENHATLTGPEHAALQAIITSAQHLLEAAYDGLDGLSEALEQAREECRRAKWDKRGTA